MIEQTIREDVEQSVKWTLEGAQRFISEHWAFARDNGFWLSLTGSVLYAGMSFKDLDVVLTPRADHEFVQKNTLAVLENLGVDTSGIGPINVAYESDPTRKYFKATFGDKKIDVILLFLRGTPSEAVDGSSDQTAEASCTFD